jgi:hypothetical protein
MLGSAFLTQSLAAIFFIAVGIRLFLLGRRTGEAPEKLLGLYFFATGWSYVGWLLPTVHQFEGGAADITDLTTWTLYSVGVIPFIFFTRLAFRPNAIWAKLFMVALSLMLLGSVSMWIVQGTGYYTLDSPWVWSHWLGYTIPCVWLSIEALLAYASANRRTRIGLCDRVVANRYLLFGLFGVFQAFACITDIYVLQTSVTAHIVDEGLDLLLGAFEIAGTAMLFLAFFPPAFYRRWISGSATGAAETVDG